MAFLSLVWVAGVVAELTLPPESTVVIVQFSTAIWVFFLLEFLVEITIAPDRLAYLRQNWYVALSVALPFFRVLRLVRALALLRTLSLGRVLLSANRATRALSEIAGGRNIGFVLSTIVVITFVSAAAVFFFERNEPSANIRAFGDAFWWAATMVTTINIGLEPVSFEGRVVAILLRVFGLAVFGYVTATIATYFIDRDLQQWGVTRTDKDGLRRQVARLSDQVEALRKELERSRNLLGHRFPLLDITCASRSLICARPTPGPSAAASAHTRRLPLWPLPCSPRKQCRGRRCRRRCRDPQSCERRATRR